MSRIIIFLLRRKFGLKIGEVFRFTNQKTSAVYYFSTDSLIKVSGNKSRLSNVSLNWLLNPECKIMGVGFDDFY